MYTVQYLDDGLIMLLCPASTSPLKFGFRSGAADKMLRLADRVSLFKGPIQGHMPKCPRLAALGRLRMQSLARRLLTSSYKVCNGSTQQMRLTFSSFVLLGFTRLENVDNKGEIRHSIEV